MDEIFKLMNDLLTVRNIGKQGDFGEKNEQNIIKSDIVLTVS